MGFIIKKKTIKRANIRDVFKELFELIAYATMKEIETIDGIHKFFSRYKTLTERQMLYLNVLVEILRKKSNVGLRSYK